MTTVPALPSVEYGKIVGQLLQTSLDSTDPGETPDFKGVTGSVTLQPLDGQGHVVDGAFLFIRSFTVSLSDDGRIQTRPGQLGVWLPTGAWRATFALADGVSLPPRDFVVATTHTDIAPLNIVATMGPLGPVITLGQYDALDKRIRDLEVLGGITPGGNPPPGVSDHGALTGLLDDDHPQYAKSDGSRGAFASVAQGNLAATAVQPAALNTAVTAAKDRLNHTGTQLAATISDLTETVQDIVGALVVAGANTTVAYNDAAGTFTISSTGGGGTGVTDAEVVRDTIGSALVAGSGIQITVNDAGDTITVASSAVLPTRTISTGAGLSGGGDLSANRSLSVLFGSAAGTVTQGDDPRLSDARTPVAHTHTLSQISDASAFGRSLAQTVDAPAARTALGATAVVVLAAGASIPDPPAPATLYLRLLPAGDTSSPTVPTGLAASSITSSSFVASWSAATDDVGVTGYEVRLGSGTPVVKTGTSHTFTGLTADTDYSVSVRARDAAGNTSAYSSPVTAHTLALAGGPASIFGNAGFTQVDAYVDGPARLGMAFYTTLAGGMDVVGMRLYIPAGVASSFTTVDVNAHTSVLTHTAGTAFSVAEVISAAVLRGTFPGATTPLVAGAWNEVLFASAVHVNPLSAASNNCLMAQITYSNTDYLIVNGGISPTTAIVAPGKAGVFMAEQTFQRGWNNLVGSASNNYPIDILVAP